LRLDFLYRDQIDDGGAKGNLGDIEVLWDSLAVCSFQIGWNGLGAISQPAVHDRRDLHHNSDDLVHSGTFDATAQHHPISSETCQNAESQLTLAFCVARFVQAAVAVSLELFSQREH
jgi:hypothetical protein